MYGVGPTLPVVTEIPSMWVLTEGATGVYKAAHISVGNTPAPGDWELQAGSPDQPVTPSAAVVKASAQEIIDGTDTDKVITPKAQKDAGIVPGGDSARWIGPWTIYGLQSQTLSFTADAGSCSYVFNGQPTSALPFDALPADYQAAFALLSSVGAGKVIASGDPGAVSLLFDDSIIPTLITVGVNTLTKANDGALITAVINNQGVGYEQGDELTISGGNGNATATVDDTVGGVITSITLQAPGAGYVDGTGVGITGGAGTGATVDVDANAGSAAASVTIAIRTQGHRSVNLQMMSAGDIFENFRIQVVEAFIAGASLLVSDEDFDWYAPTFLNSGIPIDVGADGFEYFAGSAATENNNSFLSAKEFDVAAANVPDSGRYTSALPDVCKSDTMLIAQLQNAGPGSVGILKLWIQVATPVGP